MISRQTNQVFRRIRMCDSSASYQASSAGGGPRLPSKESVIPIQATKINISCGRKANKKVLEIYSKYLGGKNDRRWRIEHAQVVTPTDRYYYSNFSIIPSVQPTHATSDMPWAEKRLCSNRMGGAYAYKSLLKQNDYLPLGTDFPVEDISPLKTYFAAVYRQNSKNKPLGGFLPNESLTRQTLEA